MLHFKCITRVTGECCFFIPDKYVFFTPHHSFKNAFVTFPFRHLLLQERNLMKINKAYPNN